MIDPQHTCHFFDELIERGNRVGVAGIRVTYNEYEILALNTFPVSRVISNGRNKFVVPEIVILLKVLSGNENVQPKEAIAWRIDPVFIVSILDFRDDIAFQLIRD
jgi:hypothetical protein